MPRNTGSIGRPGELNRMGVIVVSGGNETLTVEDCGALVTLDDTTGRTVTLPTIAAAGAGWWCEVVVTTQPTSGNGVVTEDASADTNVLVGGFNELETDTGDDGPSEASGATQVNFVVNVADVGDGCLIMCDGTNWIVRGQVAADGAVTIT